jgi:RNA-directed DNA polymerase
MMISDQQKEFIRVAFKEMKTKEDFLSLLNYSKALIYDKKSIPFELKQITYYSNTNVNRNRYTKFLISKKTGGTREINAPVKGLKIIQKSLNLILQTIYEPHKAATGFIPFKSIVDNANIHAGSHYVFNIDLKDFFSSIDQARIWGRLQVPPFNLSKATGRLDINNLIVALCCHEMEVERQDENGVWTKVLRNVLPQGAPTSPTLTNAICQQLDFYLQAVAKRFGLQYSRYADDITFSSMHNVYQRNSEFLKEVYRNVNQQKFTIKETKTRLQKNGFRQEVTGLVVNTKTNVRLRYLKELRKWLYYWETYGYEKASIFFIEKYKSDKGYVKNITPSMANVLAGKLDFLKMIKGPDNETYLKLVKRYRRLTGISDGIDIEKHVEKVQLELDLTKHRPIETSRLLANFKSSEGLKFLTHDYDRAGSTFNRQRILLAAKSEFQSLTNQHIIRPVLWARINQFAFGNNNDVWWFNGDAFKLNWNSPELIEWTKKNPNLHPIRSEKFESELILPFKKSIEIKSPDLEVIVREKLAENLGSLFGSFTIELKELDRANFYTDVDSFQKGLAYIFKAVKQRFANSKILKVQFSMESDDIGRKRIVTITHVGSTCDKPLEKSEIIKGDLGEVEKALFGICDWSIISQSPDRSINKLNILFNINSRINSTEKIPDELIDGFTHVLTFYS